MGTGKGRQRRIDPEAVLTLALEIADAGGLGAVTMRRLAADLGVTPMSLYRHFADKDALLAAIGERIGEEIEAARRERPLDDDTAEVWDRLLDRLRPPVEVLIGHHQDVTQLLQALGSDPKSRAFSGEVLDNHAKTLALLESVGIRGLEAAQWVYLLRESVFMLANACRPDRGPAAAAEAGADQGNQRVEGHWQGIAAAAHAGSPLTTAFASTSAAEPAVSAVSAAEPSLLDRGIEMLISAVRARASEIQVGKQGAAHEGV
jgi:AcrR family transcriptional regulator